MLRKILIANRGEIAVRIARAARELGIATVAVYSEADKHAVHVKVADEAIHIGPAPAGASYLNVPALLEVIKEAKVDGVHPGYGFLSENADFAEAVAAAGVTWIGPDAESIRQMGDKVVARSRAQAAGVPTVPGSDGEVHDLPEALAVAEVTGYPLAIKAGAGGGGRGIRVVQDE
ncbi:biotin carboxylase N-terminal domain-containing protein, partial [Nocardioides albidus]|uniref:biotin carboxylase N-terminal domain-containing protein n=1 Tax=Nocardioides albidus TaxID=1517589 RepID=UPI003B838A8C